jgi:hypothetical protein
MNFRVFLGFLAFTSLMTVFSSILAQEDLNEVNIDGLLLSEDTGLARLYLQPGVDVARYNRIYLGDVYIAFKKNRKRGKDNPDSDGINADDMAKMKTELSSLFREVFSRTLEEGGYELVTEPAKDVLLIKPAIINLAIVETGAPSAGNDHTYAETAGEMTLYLELYDSLSDELIAKALDRNTDRQTGYFRWQNRLSNRAAANRILQVWADVLKEGLDEARSPASHLPN